MEPRKTCANCAHYKENGNGDSQGRCMNERLNGRLCFDTDSCNLWITDAEKNAKKHLQYLLKDLSLNLKELGEILADMI